MIPPVTGQSGSGWLAALEGVKELVKAVAVERDPPTMTLKTAEFWSGRDGVCGAASAIPGVREFFHT
jgi:hypothetical protein